MPVSMTMHAKCPNTPCIGAQCRIHRLRNNTAAPRNSGPNKMEKKLAGRIDSFNQLGNPGKLHYIRPGSKKK